MRRKLFWLLALFAFVPANAQEEEQNKSIFVDGERLSKRDINKNINKFVRVISNVADNYQLSRRSSRYCPAIFGLSDEHKELVIEKIRSAANSAEISEDINGCKFNLILVFTSDADGFLSELRRRKPNFFYNLNIEKHRELFESGRPVRWWYSNNSINSDGSGVLDGVSIRYASSSLISTGISVNLSGTVVVIDVNKSSGYPLLSIASFAAMISFAQITASDRDISDLPSILGIFARESPRSQALQDMTEWDHAYLKALYRIPSDRPARQQKRRISGYMRDSLVD